MVRVEVSLDSHGSLHQLVPCSPVMRAELPPYLRREIVQTQRPIVYFIEHGTPDNVLKLPHVTRKSQLSQGVDEIAVHR